MALLQYPHARPAAQDARPVTACEGRWRGSMVEAGSSARSATLERPRDAGAGHTSAHMGNEPTRWGGAEHDPRRRTGDSGAPFVRPYRPDLSTTMPSRLAATQARH